MRKSFILFLTLLYAISTGGVEVSSFYCCGKLKDTYLLTYLHSDHGCKQKKKTKDCCDTKTVLVKVADSHTPSSRLATGANELVKKFIPFTIALFDIHTVTISRTAFAYSNDPPALSAPPAYISYCVFRI